MLGGRQRNLNLWERSAVNKLNAQRREDYMVIGKKFMIRWQEVQ